MMAYLPDACTEMENTDDSCPLIQLTSSLVSVVAGKLLHSKHRSPVNKTLHISTMCGLTQLTDGGPMNAAALAVAKTGACG